MFNPFKSKAVKKRLKGIDLSEGPYTDKKFRREDEELKKKQDEWHKRNRKKD